MKPRRLPLKRTELRNRTQLKRTTPLRSSGPVKAKRSASTVIPSPMRDAVLLRDEGRCQRCRRWVGDRRWYSLQHRDPRGMGGSELLHTMANLVALCGTGTTGCHGHVESQRTASYALGWLVPNGVTPEEWPVRRFQESWEQPGELWVPAKPHPRQVEMLGAAYRKAPGWLDCGDYVVIMTDHYRVGGKQPGNIYRVTPEHPEGERFGFTLRDEDGPLVAAALNAYEDKKESEPVPCGALDGVTGIACALIRYHSLSVDHEGTTTPEQEARGYPMFVRWPWQSYDRDFALVSGVLSGGDGK